MSINKEIKNSGKEPEVTLSVRWPTNKKEGTNSYAMLDGARVLILDENKLKGIDKEDWYKQSGLVRYLSEGKCTFSPPSTNYKVMIFAEYNEEINGKHIPRFSAHSDAYLDDETTGRRLPWSISFSNQTTFDIEDGKHNGIWSIFQAGVDLFKTSKKEKYLGYTPNQFLEIQCSEGNTETNTDYSTKIINVQKNNEGIDHSWDWNKIAHEFAHFIANDTQAIVGSPGGKHSLDVNQYDHAENEKGAYQNKELSMRLAFSEGYATWLGKCLLNGSKYIQADYALPAGSSIIGIGDSLYDYQYDLNKNVQDIPDLNNGVVTYRLTRFGEDAEISIARLLWNITNKKGGKFERIKSKDHPINKVYIPFKTLFKEVLSNKGLRNISEFYHQLFNYYVYQNNGQLSNGNLKEINLEELERIRELGHLFAEFGIAPDGSDHSQEVDTLIWYQHKTGSLPAHNKFILYFFNEDSGQFLHTTGEVDLEPEKINDHEYRYEYQFNNGDISRDSSIRKVRVLIKAVADDKSINGAIETGPYLNDSIMNISPYKEDTFVPSGTTLIIEPGMSHLISSIPIFAINTDKVKGTIYRQAVPSMFGGMDVFLTNRILDVWTRGVNPNRPVLVMLGTSTEEVTFINNAGVEEKTVIDMPDFMELEMGWE